MRESARRGLIGKRILTGRFWRGSACFLTGVLEGLGAGEKGSFIFERRYRICAESIFRAGIRCSAGGRAAMPTLILLTVQIII